MTVLCTQHLEKCNGFRIRLNTLTRTIGYVNNRLPVSGDGVYFGSFGDEIQNHLVVSAGCGVMESGRSAAAAAAAKSTLLCLRL